MQLLNFLFGRPLATSAEHDHHIGVASGIPIFGLDGLTSAAYGPEQAMSLLIPLGLIGMQRHILPIFTAILTLLVILYFSYRQTITAYPNGGGSYTVASENLGDAAGLLAAAALMIDYILTAAVGISAGVTALVSAVPRLHPHQLSLCLLILLVIVIVNMRGVKESGFAFMFPTFMFVGTLLATIGFGVYHAYLAGGHPTPVATPPPAMPATMQYLTLWLLMKAFASGCAAMTGVEAVSNGVTAFKEPKSVRANRALTVIIGVLIILLFGLSYVARACRLWRIQTQPTTRVCFRLKLQPCSGVVGFTWSRWAVSLPLSPLARIPRLPTSRAWPAPLLFATTCPMSSS